MIKGLLLIFSILLTYEVSFSAISPYGVEEIRIGFIPGTKRDTLKNNSQEFSRQLGKRLGLKVSPYVAKDYADLVKKMKNKEIDFAFFSALTYVYAEKEVQAKVLLKKVWEQPHYYSTILTLKNKKIKQIKDLKGKKVAFVDENSASGYLLPKLYLKKKNINLTNFFSKIIYTGNHYESVKALLDGKVDAIATFSNDEAASDGAWTKYAPKKRRSDFASLWVSRAIPSDPFCVREAFYVEHPRLTHDLMFNLIEWRDEGSEKKSKLKSLLSGASLALATKHQYQPLRELVKKLNLKLQ